MILWHLIRNSEKRLSTNKLTGPMRSPTGRASPFDAVLLATTYSQVFTQSVKSSPDGGITKSMGSVFGHYNHGRVFDHATFFNAHLSWRHCIQVQFRLDTQVYVFIDQSHILN